MKKTQKCPKCGCREIVVLEGKTDYYSALPVGIISRVAPDYYVCCDCGYSEVYFRQEDIERIKKSRYSHPLDISKKDEY